jgi:hypothetical protein
MARNGPVSEPGPTGAWRRTGRARLQEGAGGKRPSRSAPDTGGGARHRRVRAGQWPAHRRWSPRCAMSPRCGCEATATAGLGQCLRRSSTLTPASTTPKWLALRQTGGGRSTCSPARRPWLAAGSHRRRVLGQDISGGYEVKPASRFGVTGAVQRRAVRQPLSGLETPRACNSSSQGGRSSSVRR